MFDFASFCHTHSWLKAMMQMSKPDSLPGFSGQGLANVSSIDDESRIPSYHLKWLQLWHGNIQLETTAFGNYHYLEKYLNKYKCTTAQSKDFQDN